MDNELKTKLAVLETLLKGLKKCNDKDHKEIKDSISQLNEHVNEQINDIQKEIIDLKLWKAGQKPLWTILKWLGTSSIGALIALGIAYLSGVWFG